MPLKICCKNIVKLYAHIFSKIKKKKEKKEKKVECGNGIAEIGGEKFFFPLLFRQCHYHIQPFFFFVFFLEMICAHNFYNIFATNFKWQVVIVGLKK